MEQKQIDESYFELIGNVMDVSNNQTSFTEGESITVEPKQLEFLVDLKKMMIEFGVRSIDVTLTPKKVLMEQMKKMEEE